MIGARCVAPDILAYLDRVFLAAASLLLLNNPTRSRHLPCFSLRPSQPSLFPSISFSQPFLSFFSASSLFGVMSSNDQDTKNTGAASSAPSNRGSSFRSARPLLSRNFNSIFGGSQSRSAVPPFAKESEDPLSTLGAPIARAPLLEGTHFAGWARRGRCNLGYSMIEILNDDAWDVWRVSQVTTGVNGTQRALVRIFQGAYQVPRLMRCDRAFLRCLRPQSLIADSG